LLHGLNSLRTLSVEHCPRFKSLSEGMKHLTCLETLKIIDCPQFVFPHNMSSLTSLRQLDIWGGNESILDTLETSFSNISSLQNLSLVDFPSLTSLPDWLGVMTSLHTLQIIGFPKLSSLPDNFQDLRNLKKLSIFYCPMLEKRYKRGIGEDWHKIAHIPEFKFEYGPKPTFCGNLFNESLFIPFSFF